MAMRTTGEVLQDHLDLAQQGELELDLERNVSPDIVLMTTYGIFRGIEGVRAAAALLDEQIGRTHYTYKTQMWHGELGFLEWSAESERAVVEDGADSYWIRDGKIQAMTIHYTVTERK